MLEKEKWPTNSVLGGVQIKFNVVMNRSYILLHKIRNDAKNVVADCQNLS